jgi:hypothetical protein
MTRVEMVLNVVERLQAVHSDLVLMGLHGQLNIHQLDRATFDQLPGEETAITHREDGKPDFWVKHHGDVALFTYEPPVES